MEGLMDDCRKQPLIQFCPVIHLTADVHHISPGLLTHCEIHFYQLDLEGRKLNNRNKIPSLTCCTYCEYQQFTWARNSIWYITLCRNAPQHTINQHTFVGHLQSKHIHSTPNSQMMQCNLVFFSPFVKQNTSSGKIICGFEHPILNELAQSN